jgi:small neutral amino acid transporter SnatA (MarC family)
VTGTLAVLVASVAALNPSMVARRQHGRPVDRWLTGVVIAAIAAAVMGALAEPIRDALSVSEPTMRTAAGAVLGLTGARWLVGPSPKPGDADPTIDATLTTFSPAVVLTAMATTAQDGWLITLAGIALGVILTVGLCLRGHYGRLSAWAVRGFGAVAVVAGLAMVVNGVEVV